jgi:hypothetical protein
MSLSIDAERLKTMAAEALARAAQLEPGRKVQQQQQAPPEAKSSPETPSSDEKKTSSPGEK